MTTGAPTALVEPAAELLALADRRLADLLAVGAGGGDVSTLEDLLARLFDRDHRELLTYSAFGSAL